MNARRLALDETYRQTVSRLASAQKKAAPGAPIYSVYVNRRIGRFLAAWAWRAGLGPNQVTAISAVFSFSAIAMIALVPPAPWSGFVIALLLVIGYAFDSADGQVARLGGGGSKAGEWLDHVIDAIKISALHLAIVVGLYLHTSLEPVWLLIPLGYTLVAAVTFFALILNDLLKQTIGVKPSAVAGGGTLLRSLIVAPTDYGLLCILFVLFGWPIVFFVGYALFFIANLSFLAAALVKWFGDMKALEPPVA